MVYEEQDFWGVAQVVPDTDCVGLTVAASHSGKKAVTGTPSTKACLSPQDMPTCISSPGS